jgi:hypothetical protein
MRYVDPISFDLMYFDPKYFVCFYVLQHCVLAVAIETSNHLHLMKDLI